MVKADASIARRENRAVGNRHFQELVVVILRGDVTIQQDVRMNVRESRQNRGVRKIDHFRARRRRAAGSDGNNLAVCNQDERVGDWLAAFAVNQFARANRDLLGRLGIDGKRKQKCNCQDKGAAQHIALLRREFPIGLFRRDYRRKVGRFTSKTAGNSSRATPGESSGIIPPREPRLRGK